MTLRRKTMFIFGACLFGLLILSYVAVSSILLHGFLKHEREDAVENIKRVREVISESLVDLSGKAWDWANRDELFSYPACTSPCLNESKLLDKVFSELKLNLIVIIDSSSRIVFDKAFNLSEGKDVPVSQALREMLIRESRLLQHLDSDSGMTGLLGLPDGPMLVAARPISAHERRGLPPGTLIMGVYLDSEKTRFMARETRLKFSVDSLPLHDVHRQDLVKAMDSLSKGHRFFIQPLSGDSLAAYTLLEDISNKPVAIVRVLLERPLYQQGLTTLRYLIFSLLIIGLVYSGATLLLMEKWVLARVIGIIEKVDEIAQRADARSHLHVSGSDEISVLACAINGMLRALAASQAKLHRANEELEARVHERTIDLARNNESLVAENAERRKAEESLRRSEAKYRDLFVNAPIGIFQTSPQGTFLTANPALAHFLGYESAEMLMAEINDIGSQLHVDPSQRETLLRTALHSNGQFRFEGSYVRKDGRILTVQIHGRVVRDDGGKFLCLEGFAEDITERKHLEEVLQQAHDNLERLVEKRTSELNLKTLNLEEANAALKALLRQRDQDKEEFNECILSNVKNLIFPYIEKLKKSRMDKDQTTCLEIMENQLVQISSPFVKRLSQPYLGLTPTEIQVADLLRSGKSSKEIAQIMCLSESTVQFHRNNLRRKLGLKGKKSNLRTFLRSFD